MRNDSPSLFEVTNGLCDRMYLYGHQISLLAETNFFLRLAKYYRGLGLCFMTSALGMMMLKDNRTTTLVIVQVGESETVYSTTLKREIRSTHRFVKFQYGPDWFVLDFNCLGGRPIALSSFYSINRHLVTIREYSYNEFWSLIFPENYMRRLLNPKTSYIFLDLLIAFTHDPSGDTDSFYGETVGNRSMFIRGERYGTIMKHINPEAIEAELGQDFFKVYSRHIFNELIARPNRKRPKAHTIRRTEAIFKKYYR